MTKTPCARLITLSKSAQRPADTAETWFLAENLPKWNTPILKPPTFYSKEKRYAYREEDAPQTANCGLSGQKKTIYKTKAIDLPARLWGKLVIASDIAKDLKWADVSRKQLDRLGQFITASEFNVEGKSTFKEEFVTAGRVDLKEVNFKTFESKILPGLYFAGEVLNIDAVTGGFNFQNAWTGAYIAAQAIVKSL